ncbi:LAMI_0C04962g1_1 [Lachancea mirantina]|uniref:LAMI_0C04962g1_1 n=1 Tax=Lachancea mirantina TaxID=1230905 RepID=A0A1G4J2H9_9SACH|nr:LAMI_0C04962g1_1 [Lachancea mirantina]
MKRPPKPQEERQVMANVAIQHDVCDIASGSKLRAARFDFDEGGPDAAIELSAPRSCQTDLDYMEEDDGHTYPEGGLDAWLVTFGSFLGIFPTWGLYFSAGVIQTYIASNQLAQVSTSTISWIFSLYNFFMLGSSVLSGLYFDVHGVRKPVLLGSALFLAGSFVLGNCSKVWHFLLCFSCLNGIGTGVLTAPLLGVVCHYFSRKRATATALAINGGSIGGVVYPLLLRSLYNKIGYSWTMRIMAFIALALLVASACLVKEDVSKLAPPSNTTASAKPREKTTPLSLLRDLARYILQSFDHKALSDPRFLFCTLGTCFAELSTGATLTYLASYCTDVGYSENDSFLVVTVLNALSIAGGYFYGYLADCFAGRFNVMVVINVCLGILPLALWLPFGQKKSAVMLAFAALYGFFYGSLLNLAPVCCGQICRTDQFGTRYSTMYFLVGLTFLAGIPITGAIIGDGTLTHYRRAIIFISTMAIVSGVFFFISKVFSVRCYALKSEQRQTHESLLKSSYKLTIKRF